MLHQTLMMLNEEINNLHEYMNENERHKFNCHINAINSGINVCLLVQDGWKYKIREIICSVIYYRFFVYKYDPPENHTNLHVELRGKDYYKYENEWRKKNDLYQQEQMNSELYKTFIKERETIISVCINIIKLKC